MIKNLEKYLLWIIQAGTRDFSRFYYTNLKKIFVRLHPCISGGEKLSINGSVRIKVHSSAHLSLGVGCIINTGPTANPVGAVPFSVIAALRDSVILIGANVGLSNCCIVARKSIVIEDNVLLGGGVMVLDSDHHVLDYRSRSVTSVKDIRDAEVVIGRGAFVGALSIILKGSKIGEGSVIGAGSVVSGLIPPYEIWTGNPARFVKKIIHQG